MKKHVFGFVIFSVIVVTFIAIFFAADRLRMPSVNEVEIRDERVIVSCPTSRSAVLPHKVQSVQFDLDSKKLIVKIRVGVGRSPQKLFVNAKLSDLNGFSFDFVETATVALNNRNEAYLSFETYVPDSERIDRTQNFYFSAVVSESAFTDVEHLQNNGAAHMRQVLFVHGNASILKK
ncbi:MAG: hypothetical protein H7070_14415 [Saprospiraceae bacterium]|nr:hypothetical protein [Pyrinomonadaceae bacterium]